MSQVDKGDVRPELRGPLLHQHLSQSADQRAEKHQDERAPGGLLRDYGRVCFKGCR